MSSNKTLVYKPGLQANLRRKSSHRAKEEKTSFKEKVKEIILNFSLILCGVLLFVISVAIGYKSYILISLKVEKHNLIRKNQELKTRYQTLTSREVVLEKAKKLGLYPPHREDNIYLN